MDKKKPTVNQLEKQIKILTARVKELEKEELMRTKTMKALSESNDRFSSLIEEAPDAIILVDPNTGMVLYANPFASELLKGEHDEIVGKFQNDLFPPKDTEEYLREFKTEEKSLYVKKYPRRFENKIKRCDGVEIPVEAAAKTLLVDGDLLLMCILRDMSAHKKMEEDLRNAKIKAEMSDKLKSDFLSQISHEVRTPINTIVNFTNIYREEILSKFCKEEADEIDYGFKVIDKAASRLIRTIDLMVNLSEVSSGTYLGRPEIIDLVKDIITPLSKKYSDLCLTKKIKYEIENQTRAVVTVDKFSILQIFENIYNNAARFTEKGVIRTTVLKEKDRLKIVISDTGIGISKEYLPYVFDTFSQEEQGYTRSFEGNGLGLALVKKYCELNKIEVEIKSIKGHGTEVILTFNR